MTGFGRGKAELRGGRVTIEIKTVNHKFFEMTAKLPNHISVFEDRIKEIVQKKIKRGKVNLNLIYDGVIVKDERVSVNVPLAKSYYHALSKLQRTLNIKGEALVDDLILFPGVLNYEVREESLVRLWPKIKEALDTALGTVVADRIREGRALHKDLARRAACIEKMLRAINDRAEVNIGEYRKKFAQRVKELSGGQKMDSGRLEMEVAIFAKNCDISEEITRLENHLANFGNTISRDDEAGKKLDFIAQELHREINTIGAKAGDFKISKNVIDIKSEIEKIREQVKNLE
jgi:uncharacterized protein (TIGR00255 family)